MEIIELVVLMANVDADPDFRKDMTKKEINELIKKYFE